MQFKSFMEALKGKQHKIDKNKNGKIDAHDFKLLQKEEAEQLEEGLDPSEVAGNPRMYSADTVKKAFYHKKASAGDKESLARHLDRHHGNKDWRKSVKEESEQIDELSRGTLLSYANKVSLDSQKHSKDPTRRSAEKANRSVSGYAKAHNRLEKPVKEEAELTEATVKTEKYSWGTMKTVHHGKDFSIPLHPEHHQAIAKLKDEQEHKFKDETGRHWTARRKGEDVHFQSANDGPKTQVKHSELKESEERMARADYKTSASGRKSHKEIVFGDAETKDDEDKNEKKDKIDEKAPPGFEGTVKAMKKHKEIDNPYALAWYMKNKGMKSHKKEDGTMKEAFINGREYASHGLMHPDHAKMSVHQKTGQTVDFYAHGTGDKVSGKVVKNDGKAVHIKDTSGKTHQFKVTPHLPKKVDESKKEDPPFDGPYKKAEPVKNSDGTTQSSMSRARELAQMAMKKKLKEDIDRLFEAKDDSEYNFEGEMAVTQLKTICRHAEALEAKMKPDTNLPEWVQAKITLATDYMQTAHDYLMSELEEQAPVAPVPDKKYIKGTPENKAHKASRKPINGIPTGKYKEDIDFNDEGELMTRTVSYKEFLEINEIKMSDLPSRVVRGHSYGANYSDPEGADDYDDKPTKPAPEKRGRGRPAGAQSGARKILGTSKLHTK